MGLPVTDSILADDWSWALARSDPRPSRSFTPVRMERAGMVHTSGSKGEIMRNSLIVLALLCSSCASTGPERTSSHASIGQEGTSIQTSVPIKATNSAEGVAAEYAWIARKHPGFKRESQSLLLEGKRAYDLIEITTADGKRMAYYFDVTSFFGKW